MKLTTVLLIIASIAYSSLAYPAGGHPDDDVEVIDGGSQPGFQPTPPDPSIPSIPSIPNYPLIPSIPTYPSVPVYPSYPIYPSYPTYPNFFPFGWTYNLFNGFSNFVRTIGNEASSAWSRVPSIRPLITNYLPDPKSGSTTSTVKIVGDHKFIINETVHVQQNDFGHVVFKVRTVDIKPLSDETTEGVDNETTVPSNVDIDEPYTTQKPVEGVDDNDDRVSVDDTGDIDGIRADSPEILDDANEIAVGSIEEFEVNTSGSIDGGNVIKSQSLVQNKDEKVEIESLSVEDHKSNEWSALELGNDDEQKNTYYEVNNENDSNTDREEITHDLTNDIAINQMLADQGAAYNPDAEVFDISQFELTKISSHEDKKPQQESFDYLPYHHIIDKKPTTIK